MTIPLGQMITGEAGRDAVHIAIAPVTAGERLLPGQHVGVIMAPDVVARSGDHIGIVDPFLTTWIEAGARFYLCLYPNSITSLRHEWTHPSFLASLVISTSEAWLRDFAEEIGLSYGQAVEAMQAADEHGQYHTFGYDTPDICYKELDQMWRHYEIVTGRKVKDTARGVFSCAC